MGLEDIARVFGTAEKVLWPNAPVARLQFLFAFDVVGFVTIAVEWAYGYRRMQQALRDQPDASSQAIARFLRIIDSVQSSGETLTAYADVMAEFPDFAQVDSSYNQVKEATRWRRYPFLIGSILVIVGFILQALGTLPNCCLILGITPS